MPTKKVKTTKKKLSPTKPTKSCCSCGFHSPGYGCRLVSANCANSDTKPSYIDKEALVDSGRPELKSEKVLLSSKSLGKLWKGIDK